MEGDANITNWKQTPGGLETLSKMYGKIENTNLFQREKYLEHLDSLEPGDWYLPLNHHPTEAPFDAPYASMDIALDSRNKGFQLLMKMGWKENTGLGKDGHGIVDPIRLITEETKLGLGKAEEQDAIAVETTEMRRLLEVEQQANEDEERKNKRQEKAEKAEKIIEHVKDITKVFYCDICKKQYKAAMQFEEHLNSYDHHHKKRFVEMQQGTKGSAEDREKERLERQKRETKRAEKEMANLLKLQQSMQAAKQQPQPTAAAEPLPSSTAAAAAAAAALPSVASLPPSSLATISNSITALPPPQPAPAPFVPTGGTFKMQLGGGSFSMKPKIQPPPAKKPCVFQDDDD